MEVWIAVVFFVLNGQAAFWTNDHQFKSEQKCNAVLEGFMTQLQGKGIPQAAGTCISVRIGTFV
ncbi:MAG: hypothetical protein RL715_812 [Chloroflexota bacterium]|jgi:hypothetical protein